MPLNVKFFIIIFIFKLNNNEVFWLFFVITFFYVLLYASVCYIGK